jgi:hypothetical protein
MLMHSIISDSSARTFYGRAGYAFLDSLTHFIIMPDYIKFFKKKSLMVAEAVFYD